jgi:hypothetical protein
VGFRGCHERDGQQHADLVQRVPADGSERDQQVLRMEHVSLRVMGDFDLLIEFILPTPISHDTGHFFQMAYDRATYVGCAFARYTDSYKTGLFACNYASGNIQGYKIYKCGKPAGGCLFGNNPSYPALCNENEPIDPNQIY